MRKNQYEEALFKCEDDQFEIDMIIDTNTSAIRILGKLLCSLFPYSDFTLSIMIITITTVMPFICANFCLRV